METAQRLQRLQSLVDKDIEALPDRPREPDAVSSDDDDSGGGVSLLAEPLATGRDASSSEQPPVSPNVPAPVIKTAFRPVVAPEENTERRFIWLQGVPSTWNLGGTRLPAGAPNSSKKLPPTNFRKGDLSPNNTSFTNIYALAKYPYKFVGKDISQELATKFFDAGKFWNREWDLFYVWPLDESKPLILVREDQFVSLLNEINRETHHGLKITQQQREDGLTVRFPEHPRLTPRYLGRTSSKGEVETMAQSAPPPAFGVLSEHQLPPPNDRSIEAFKDAVERGLDAAKAKSKAQRLKKKEERVIKQLNIARQFKRTQRYLGLRPKLGATAPQKTGNKFQIQAIDVDLPVPFPFDSSVVIVCVDVESFERHHGLITEVGIATLDTRDLEGVHPGKDGKNWFDKIRARHFRIQEHKHMINHEFVTGCPNSFEFGESEFISLRDAPKFIESCFKHPYSKFHKEDKYPASLMEGSDLNKERKIVLLGHDTETDIRYLQQLGYNPLNLPNLVESLDTAMMYRFWRREQQQTKLVNILYDFDIVAWNPHNAGNDAYYTVQAMLAISVREASIRGTGAIEAMREHDREEREARAKDDAARRAQEEAEGWSSTEEFDDGGDPVPTVIRDKEAEGLSRFAEVSSKKMQTKSTNSFGVMSPKRESSDGARGGFERGRGQLDTFELNGYRGRGSYRGNNQRGGFNDRDERYNRGNARAHRGSVRSRGRGFNTSSGLGWNESDGEVEPQFGVSAPTNLLD